MPRSGLRESPAKTRYGVVIDADFPMCQICKKTFSSKSSRKRHLLRVHGVSDDNVEVDAQEPISQLGSDMQKGELRQTIDGSMQVPVPMQC